MIGIILLQKGEEGDGMGGGAGSLFSARGMKTGLTTTTAILASIFFTDCLILAILVKKESVLSVVSQPLDKDSPTQTLEKREDSSSSEVKKPVEQSVKKPSSVDLPISPLPSTQEVDKKESSSSINSQTSPSQPLSQRKNAFRRSSQTQKKYRSGKSSSQKSKQEKKE